MKTGDPMEPVATNGIARTLCYSTTKSLLTAD
jgi:hypothetical protein